MQRTWSIRVILIATVAILSSLAPIARAGAVPDVRRDQVAAANGQALAELRKTIYAESIGDGFTVRELIEKTGSKKRFVESIARAQQIGGPRWLSGDTCQVKLEIPAGRVRDTLVNIATQSRLESPVPPDVLQGRLQDWTNRKFSATGTSMGPGAVPEGAPGKGVCDARDAAVAQTLAAIRPIPFAGGKTVGDALAQPGVGDDVEKWLAARPITQIEFPDASGARVSLAVPPDELFDTFRVAAGAAVVKQRPVQLPRDENEWNKVRDEFANRVTPAVTRGVAKAGGGAGGVVAVQHAAVAVPGAAPDWAEQQIDAEGKGTASGSQLKAARAAEADAANKLRAKLDPLPLTNGQTIAQAVAQNKLLENALDRALVRAHTTQVDYQGVDSATVKVQLDLREVWRELESAPSPR
ncbi:MAG: hypothetical protein QOF78_3796 [Phycisphaerales bacterium]|nr:hypothetical protein [Phycisphaerales bacterium]